MKVVFWGGSSQSTPALGAWLGEQDIRRDMALILIGRSASRLSAVARACRILTDGKPIRIHSHLVDDPNIGSVLNGADLIVIQVRIGGYEGRSFDEHLPLPYITTRPFLVFCARFLVSRSPR
uniref:6-phospho-beta-glucosidase n=1 Tax=Candidatus Kentrum sp. FM TaxID=2126340 RepID=A0A450SVI2_9GAMM|nr:MAG: 6-phospho-beta-glucosidase [Candidatus Kentron sp. FM]VFJ76589.1 MAG: 6-phospho-beta-glucosidase [Candidatus Kentron sp. FM]VFK21381.1 MAG: 6-phospho-beta-glucosidase [Candidatus Kentron sp. FM]